MGMRLEGSRAVGCDDAGREWSWRLRELEVRVSADTRGVFMLSIYADFKSSRKEAGRKFCSEVTSESKRSFR